MHGERLWNALGGREGGREACAYSSIIVNFLWELLHENGAIESSSNITPPDRTMLVQYKC